MIGVFFLFESQQAAQFDLSILTPPSYSIPRSPQCSSGALSQHTPESSQCLARVLAGSVVGKEILTIGIWFEGGVALNILRV